MGECTALELVGVVSHSGTLKSGHYVAYVKRVQAAAREKTPGETSSTEEVVKLVEAVTLEEREGSAAAAEGPAERVEQWFYVSDTHVNRVSVAQVLACEAYVLIYARRQAC